MSEQVMQLKLKVWRQKDKNDQGSFVELVARDVSPDMSFLEMLDVVNEDLIKSGQEPIAFEHDCREGICGSCGFMINGLAHGPAVAFPVLKDLMVDRSAFDRIVASGGYVSVNTGNAPEANNIPIPKPNSDEAMDAAACIGCGACVAQCKNASAALFTSAKIAHLSLLPQGAPERETRVLNMVIQASEEGFGACSNEGECEAVCPKGISIKNIAFMNKEYRKAAWRK
jgi:succinate dehydrogenase / fumarate reductase iron-sulfur subunit